MKLVLFSGGNENINRDLNLKSIELTKKNSPKMTFIPTSSYYAEEDFQYFVNEYSKLGVEKFLQFSVDAPYSKILLEEVLKSDLIFLGGGNTFYFLKHLKKSGMANLLKQFVKNGGVLCGLSAGAIVFTPHVHTATFPEFDRDENPWKMKNLSALKLVNFEFFPHYKNSKRYEKELLKHSLQTKIPLYAAPDGSGIIIEDNNLTFHGKIFQFYLGKKLCIC